MHSWAYNNDRGLPYLLSCYKRLPAATATDPRCDMGLGGGLVTPSPSGSPTLALALALV
jgi:hypothetical protein